MLVGPRKGERSRGAPPSGRARSWLARGGSTVTQKRKRIWIDRFQTLLSLRLALYLILYQVAVWAIFSLQKHTTEVLERLIGSGAVLFSILAWSAGVILAVLFIID